MNEPVKLSMNGRFGLNGILVIISFYFLISPLIYWEWNDNSIYWVIGSSLILVFEFFVFKNFRDISFNSDNVFLKSYFSKKVKVIPIENIIRIRQTTARQSAALFYSWLVYRDGQSEREVLFILLKKNYLIFYELLKNEGIDLDKI